MSVIIRKLTKPLYPRIYGCPPLEQGSALSSWIMQVAAVKRRPVREIVKLWGYQISNAYYADISWRPPPLSIMASMTFESQGRLEGLLWSRKTTLADQLFSCLTENQNGSPIHLFCPICLKKDTIPYLRIKWRLAYQFLCEQHHCLLHDSCPHCKKIIDYSKFYGIVPKSGVESFFRLCPFCYKDLTVAKNIVPDPNISLLMNKAQNTLHRLITVPYYKHPTAGTISSKRVLLSFLLSQKSDSLDKPEGAVFTGIDFHRLFLNRDLDIATILQKARRGL